MRSRHLFFFNDTATTEIYTLSLHDALPICRYVVATGGNAEAARIAGIRVQRMKFAVYLISAACAGLADRKSTRLNSSHANISYAVFCLKKKKNSTMIPLPYIYLILYSSYSL